MSGTTPGDRNAGDSPFQDARGYKAHVTTEEAGLIRREAVTTANDLASRAGMSRSIFAQRFREVVGETAIGYLTRWRMMLASERLVTTDSPLFQVALSLGYDSETAFNTAFKRGMGCSPRRYARAETFLRHDLDASEGHRVA